MKLETIGRTAVQMFETPIAGGTLMHPKCAFLATHVIDAPDGWCCSPHTHEFFEVLHTISGTYTCEVNQKPLVVNPGQTLMVRPGDVHEDTVGSTCSFLVVQFLLLGLRHCSAQLELFGTATAPSDLIFSNTSELITLYQERAAHAVDQPDPITPYLLDSWTLTLFWELLKTLPPRAFSADFSVVGQTNTLEDRLLELFRNRVQEPLSVEDMAAHLGMSVSSLERACRKELHVLPARAFARFRMEEALELLKFSRTPIKVISDTLGFQNPNHFSTAFSRYFGRPPSSFRDASLTSPA